jgi:microcystin degradation protein MlrC
MRTPRIGIGGFLHESNTFLESATDYEHFRSTSMTRGPELIERWRGTHHEIGGFIEAADVGGFVAVPLLATFAVPGGTVTADGFERIAAELADTIKRAGPLDGLLLALHGATVAQNHPDADGDLLALVRGVVGADLPLAVTFDLHANISRKMISHTTATVVYRSNPHLDQRERGLEAARLVVRVIAGGIQPVQALETPPMLIRMSRQYTFVPPARGLYDDLEQVLRWPGVLSASVAMGFPYADVAEMGTSFVVVADGDHELARKAARWMSRRSWDRREEFTGSLAEPAEAVRMAVKAERGPVVLMDIGDNVGGGSPGDSTVLFAEVLRQGASRALVVLYDPEAVSECVLAGVRQPVTLRVGGKTDRQHGEPVEVRGRVRTVSDGMFVERQVCHGGWTYNDQGLTVVVETATGHTVVRGQLMIR